MDYTDVKSQKDRIAQAQKNITFYEHGCDLKHRFTPENYLDDNNAQRQSWLMRQVVAIQSRDLYRQSPTRIVPDNDEATEWLAKVYKQNAMWAKFPEADRLSTVTDVAWFQIAATGDLDNPLRINLYASNQIAATEDKLDPTQPGSVTVISSEKDNDDVLWKFTEWTDGWIEVYTIKGSAGSPFSSVEEPKVIKSEPNPYGVIPFARVHNQYPTTGLWTSSPGTYLYKVNKYLNWRLSQVANLIRSNPPMKVISNADAAWTPPQPLQPQDFLQVPGAGPGNQKDGVFKYEQANLSFVASEWEDLQNYIDHTLECLGIPPAAYRQVQTSAKSGAALMVEQISLIETAKARQMPFSHYEECLAKLCFTVFQEYYGTPLVDLKDFSLTVKWPSMWPDLPGPERDRADQWDLDNDLISLIGLLIKRDHLTEEEAIAHLEKVAEDKKEQERILGVEPPPVVVMGGDGMSPGDLPQEDTNKED